MKDQRCGSVKSQKESKLKAEGEGSLQLFLKLENRLLFNTTHISLDAAFLYLSVYANGRYYGSTLIESSVTLTKGLFFAERFGN